jgi:hypothetical protein
MQFGSVKQETYMEFWLGNCLEIVHLDVCYLTMLSVSGIYSVDNRMISERGEVGGMRIGRGN